MSDVPSIDSQVEQILDPLAGGQDLAVVIEKLMWLEASCLLVEHNEAAMFCVELQRYGAHQLDEPSEDGFRLFQSALHRLSKIGTDGFASGLLELVAELRAARGARNFDEAATLHDHERVIWREKVRRSNVLRQVRRRASTVVDLVSALRDAAKAESALALLCREAEALKRVFRFNPSSLVWTGLVELTRVARGYAQPIDCAELARYCQALTAASADARSLAPAQPALQEICAHIANLDGKNLLARLISAAPELIAPKALSPEPEPDRAPLEVRALKEALENLQDQIAAGVLEATQLSQDLIALAERVQNSHRQSSDIDVNDRLAWFSSEFMQLAEVIDLVASGGVPSDSDIEMLRARLQDYVRLPRSLRAVDEALCAMHQLRARLAAGVSVEIEEDLAALTTLAANIGQDETDADEAVFGYLLSRGDLDYAIRDLDDGHIEPWTPQSSALSIDALFPHTEPLGAPRQVLNILVNGNRVALACDRVQGPMRMRLSHRMSSDHGFAMRLEGRSLCVIRAKDLSSHCR